MAVSMEGQLMSTIGLLRFQPTAKRIRVWRDGAPVADTTRAVLVWEPHRVVPSYAVPESDLLASLSPAPAGATPEYRSVGFGDDGPPVLDPSVPFTVHTAEGKPLTVDTLAGACESAAFRLVDHGLQGHVELDFEAFDWQEEDEPVVGHPRDPFHRIDVRPSSRTVRLEHEGRVLAESARCRFLFEGAFPMARYYLPREDVRVELIRSDRRTTCAYKGHATHYTARLGEDRLEDIAWSYEEPLEDATRVHGLICFYHERLDVFVDGERLERIRTPWS